ncbi:DUF4244 domain-containing protein [Microbispora hainanensis]|uniref:DUF4244 domain-containing protein n=1 Tax=Microbispora hainanensis TaxID=568844 RepID=A0A544Z5F7_9ACTN|nr:DUF4244 domain-containing protein [Microbispora hainanensis]TQS24287.1 DUF4244 domain-containing protein [Microbispora hainanensis]
MSKHAATGRRNQTGTTLRRRDASAVGRHRARPARWAALLRSARRALLGRSGRASLFTRFGRWAGVGRLRNAVQAVGGVSRRSCAALRRSVGTASRRARELSVQWAVQAGTRADAGMSTAEYAVGTIAACGFAALLWKVVTSAEVRSMLAALIQKALKLAA